MSAYLCIYAEPELVALVAERGLQGRVAGEEGRVEVDDAERGPRAVDGRDRQSLLCASEIEVLTESREARQRAPKVCVESGRGVSECLSGERGRGRELTLEDWTGDFEFHCRLD